MEFRPLGGRDGRCMQMRSIFQCNAHHGIRAIGDSHPGVLQIFCQNRQDFWDGCQSGVEPSVVSLGASDPNALAETKIGPVQAEVMHRSGPWRSFDAAHSAELEWVAWLNNRRPLEPIGNIPPAEAEANLSAPPERSEMAAQPRPTRLRKIRCNADRFG